MRNKFYNYSDIKSNKLLFWIFLGILFLALFPLCFLLHEKKSIEIMLKNNDISEIEVKITKLQPYHAYRGGYYLDFYTNENDFYRYSCTNIFNKKVIKEFKPNSIVKLYIQKSDNQDKRIYGFKFPNGIGVNPFLTLNNSIKEINIMIIVMLSIMLLFFFLLIRTLIKIL
jgi:hypothetical protein